MKILHIIPDLATSTGGPVEALKIMSVAQTTAGHDITIATTDFGFDQNLNLANVDIKVFPCTTVMFRYSLELKKYLNKNITDFDIIHLHTIWTFPTFIAGKLARKYNIPYILRPCGMLDEWSFSQKYLKKIIYYTLFEKKTINNASFIHCTSISELEESKKYRLNENTYILPLAVNIGKVIAKIDNYKDTQPYILFFSRLHYKKKPDLLIKAFAKIHQRIPNYKLVLAGPCDEVYKQKLDESNTEIQTQQKSYTNRITYWR